MSLDDIICELAY